MMDLLLGAGRWNSCTSFHLNCLAQVSSSESKGLTDSGLVADIELSVLVEGVVVVANLGGRRFEV